MKSHQIQFTFVYGLLDVGAVWEKFLPHAQKCWQLQRDCFTCGNCHDWWKSRFYDFFIGHGHSRKHIEQMDHDSMAMFPAIWEKYGLVLQGGAK